MRDRTRFIQKREINGKRTMREARLSQECNRNERQDRKINLCDGQKEREWKYQR
jgi:hypothetical protein